MATYFMDTSALVKRFHREAGSVWIREIFSDMANDQDAVQALVYASALCLGEVPSAVAILERTRQISIELRDELFQAFIESRARELQILQLTNQLLLDAGTLTQRYPLKAYDAVQLASVQQLANRLEEFEERLVFVASDKQLLQAAQAEGLIVDNPLWHDRDFSQAPETRA